MRESTGATSSPVERLVEETYESDVRAALGEEAMLAERETGRRQDPDEAAFETLTGATETPRGAAAETIVSPRAKEQPGGA